MKRGADPLGTMILMHFIALLNCGGFFMGKYNYVSWQIHGKNLKT